MTDECNKRLITVTEQHETEMASVKEDLVIVKQERDDREKVIKNLQEENRNLELDLKQTVEELHCTRESLDVKTQECTLQEDTVKELRDFNKIQK